MAEQLSMFEAGNKKRKLRGGGGGSGSNTPSGGGGGGEERPTALAEEAQRRYLNYALSVITARALPDVRDGLKPVQRRVLYGMWNEGISADAKFRKCANVVGAVMGQFHPHGEQAIYDALVRLAQDFSLRYPLVDGHGNFGSLDGDAAAAMRYTECRLERRSDELLGELDQETVHLRPTYDGSKNEPVVLPARLPNLLMNGSTGIAVGMATNIPPHNLGELLDACVALIDNPELPLKGILKLVKGPDFPTGGQVLNSKKELEEIYQTGQGSIRLRGEWKLEAKARGGRDVVITSVPYQVNKGNLVARIGEIVADRKLPTVTDVRDESTNDVRIVLELKRDSDAELAMAYLYKHTPLQTSFGVNLTCLVPTTNPEVGSPRRLDLKEALTHFLNFRLEVISKGLAYRLAQLEARLHVLEGFEKVYDALDEMLRIIRRSEGKEDAAKKLSARFSLTDPQTDAILEMKLYRLARLEILVIRRELGEKRTEAKRIEGLLRDDKRGERARWGVVRDELVELKKAYADPRRTKITGPVEEAEYSEDAFIADEDVQVVVTRDGWVKRVRELKLPSSTRMREGDAIMAVVAGTLKSPLVFFSNRGSAYVTRFHDIPASTGYGDPVQKLFKFDDGERIIAAYSLDPRTKPSSEQMLAVSRGGLALRFALAPHTELSTRAGRRYARPADDDEIIGVAPCPPKSLVAVLTERTYGLVCRTEEVAELAGPGRGVILIKVGDDDAVVGMVCGAPRVTLPFETEKGRTLAIDSQKYELTGRGGRGRELSRKDKVRALTLPPVGLPAGEEE